MLRCGALVLSRRDEAERPAVRPQFGNNPVRLGSVLICIAVSLALPGDDVTLFPLKAGCLDPTESR